jgi:hypothetical protein
VSAGNQILWLLVLSIPVASLSWTVTHEEIFRDLREHIQQHSRLSRTPFGRKLVYPLSCEYCFSHYVSLLFVWIAHFTLLLPGWRGTLIAWLAIVYVANFYMSAYARLRLDIRGERTEVQLKEIEKERIEKKTRTAA